MAKYRKRPVEVEAEQWFPGKAVPGVYGLPGQGLCPCYVVGGSHSLPHVLTAHGQAARLSPGDWVVTEPDGVHHYPCKDEIFRAFYEPAEG